MSQSSATDQGNGHSIDPTAGQVRRLRDCGPNGPMVMLNRLKFRAVAAYSRRAGTPLCPVVATKVAINGCTHGLNA